MFNALRGGYKPQYSGDALISLRDVRNEMAV